MSASPFSNKDLGNDSLIDPYRQESIQSTLTSPATLDDAATQLPIGFRRNSLLVSRRPSRLDNVEAFSNTANSNPLLRTLRRKVASSEEQSAFSSEELGLPQHLNLRQQLQLQASYPLNQEPRVSLSNSEHRLHSASSIQTVSTNVQNSHGMWVRALQLYRSTTQYLQISKPFQVFSHAVVLMVDALYLILYFIEMWVTLGRVEPLIADKTPSFLWIPRPYPIWFALLSLSVITTFLSTLRLTLSSQTLFHYIFSLPTLIDMVTSVPFIILSFIRQGRFFYVPYFLRVLLILPRLRRVLNFQMVFEDFFLSVDPVRERFITLIGTIAVIFIMTICCIHFTEVIMTKEPLDIISLIYFVTVTLSTVGYGDISVQTVWGRVVIVISIFVAIATFSSLLTSALEAWKDSKKGSGSFSGSQGKHIVIIGNIMNPSAALDLLRVVFNNRHGRSLKLVFLGSKKLPREIKSIFNSPFFKDRVTFLQGSALNQRDLTRAQARSAQGIFVLSSQSNMDDEKNILRIWAIANYAPTVPIHVYVYNSQYGHYIDQFTTSMICYNDTKQTLMAYNCLHKGIATLITNLITPVIPLERYPLQWQIQYGDGTNNQIVEWETLTCFVGLKFNELATFFFEHSNIILFAIRAITKDGAEHVMINPGEKYKFTGFENLICMTQSLGEVERLQEMSDDEVRSLFSEKFKYIRNGRLPGSPSAFSRKEKHVNSSKLSATPSFSHISTLDLVRGQPMNPYSSQKVPLCHIKIKPFQTHMEVLLMKKELSGHIVVISNTWDLFWFFCTLRSIHIPISEQRPILVFAQTLPTEEEFRFLASFPTFYILQGNPRNRHDLISAQVHLAHSVVIFSSESPNIDKNDFTRSEFEDLEAIIIRYQVKKIIKEIASHPVHVVIELQNREALRFLSSAPISQVAFDPYASQALEKGKNANSLSDTFYHPLYASGEGFVSSMLDNILFQDYFNPAILDVVNLFSGVRSAVDALYDEEFGIEASNLSVIPLPKKFENKPFKMFFREYCLLHSILPLGLYRAPSSALENTEPFVYTGPYPETILKKSDSIFVLSRQGGFPTSDPLFVSERKSQT